MVDVEGWRIPINGPCSWCGLLACVSTFFISIARRVLVLLRAFLGQKYKKKVASKHTPECSNYLTWILILEYPDHQRAGKGLDGVINDRVNF